MKNMSRLWIAIFLSGTVTFAIRYFFFMTSGSEPSEKKKELLSFIPPATFAALAASAVFHGGISSISLSNPYLWAGAAAVFTAVKIKNTLLTIAVGMIIIWLWNAGYSILNG